MSHKLESNIDGPSPVISARVPSSRYEQLSTISEASGVPIGAIARNFMELGMAELLGVSGVTDECRSTLLSMIEQVTRLEKCPLPVEAVKQAMAIQSKLREQRMAEWEKRQKKSTSR